MPTLTLLTNNIFINPSLFELVGMDQARVIDRSATQIVMTGSPGGGSYTLIGTGLGTAFVNGREFINAGTVQTIEFRLFNTNFNITNLNLNGFDLGNALLNDFVGSQPARVEELFLGLNYTILGTTGNDTHVRNIATSNDGASLTLTGNNFYELAAGNDVVTDAGTGGDTISGGSGNDELRGGDGADSLLGGNDNDTLRGEAGNDTLSGGEGVDQLFGGADNDLLLAAPRLNAGETFDGGDGIDTLSFAGLDFGSQGGYAVSLPSQTGNFNNLFGTFPVSVVGIENLIGSEQGDDFFGDGLANLLDGRGGNDVLQGEGGNDTLIGGEGLDDLSGGANDDLLLVGPRLTAGERFDGGSGIDTLSFAGLDFGAQGGYVVGLNAQSANFNTGNFLVSVVGVENVIGSVQADSFSGDELANLLDGREGADTLVGLGGNDTLIGGAGSDRLFGGDNNDLLQTGSTGLTIGEIYDGDGGIDTFSLEGLAFGGFRVSLFAQVANLLTGGSQVTLREVEIVIGSVDGDEITGSIGNDTLEGRQGSDTLIGDSGSDRLDGGTGADIMFGGADNDLYVVDDAGDVVSETGNAIADGLTDEVSSSVSFSIADGGAQFIERLRLTGTGHLDGTGNGLNNHISGNDGNNNLLGLGGNDVIVGGQGNDTLNGGTGNDTMFGNEGDDVYIVFDALDVASEAINGITDEGGTDTVETFVTYSLNGTDGRQFIENLTLIPGGNAVDGTGNELNNVIIGNGAANSLNGGLGNDTLNGGTGIDTLTGGDGSDTYIIETSGDRVVETNANAAIGGTDSVVSSLASYTLTDNVENLTLTGVAAINGTGNILNNIITGNSAANVLNGGAGADTLTGGDGNDAYAIDNAGDVVIESNADPITGGIDRVVSLLANYTLNTNVENLALGGGATNGTGNVLNNIITGNSAANVLNGGAGADTLTGGDGNDAYVIDNAGDLVFETNANPVTGGTDRVVSSLASYTLTANVETLTLGGGAINGTGNVLNNTITGNSAANSLNGAAGADTLTGGDGNDAYVIDNAGDLVFETNANPATGGFDTVLSSLTAYILTTNVENLTLTGVAAINGTGNILNNIITGNSAANVLNGGAGIDTLIGGDGNDAYVIETVGDLIIETNANAATGGTDRVVSSLASYTLTANVETLTLGGGAINGTGNVLNNTITGNSAANSLIGAAGNDTLIGGAGNDTLTGGLNADTFRFDSPLNASTNRDLITDFILAQTDRIELENSVFTTLTTPGTLADAAFTFGASATAASHRILYNATTGLLSFDSDGNGAAAAIAFATVTPGLALSNASFTVT